MVNYNYLSIYPLYSSKYQGLITEPIEQAAPGWSRRAPTLLPLLLMEVFEVVNWIQFFQASGKPALSCLRHFNPTAN